MKIKIVKAAFAAACVVAAGMGCFKAYTASNQSESSMLLAENVEALSKEDGDKDVPGLTNKAYRKLLDENGNPVMLETTKYGKAYVEICRHVPGGNEDCILNAKRYRFPKS